MTTYQTPQTRQGIDGLALAALVFIAFGGLMLFRDIRSNDSEAMMAGEVIDIHVEAAPANSVEVNGETGSGQEIPTVSMDDSLIAAPYDQYTITQGPHGFSYGHMAIDIAAGKGAIIKSPISGYVSDLYVDQYGNPTLVIENEIYQVTMLHGKFKVVVGDQVQVGQMLGRESNKGHTTDMWGRSCRNRDCGYHTHLNIFDKRIGSNINPLDVIQN